MPRLLANRELPLPRFWIPFAPDNNQGAPHTLFLNDGILPDPEDSYGKVANRSLTTLAIIAQKRCFALLGQPGLGKSITVKQWVDDMRSRALPGALVVLLRSVEIASADDIRRDTIETAQWREARACGSEITLVLDGLDEAIQRLPVLLHRLRKCLESEPVVRTRLALVSRVADWRDSRADELFALWPEHERGGAFELCPLRWKDVRLAATESGVNADAFTRAVCERRVGWMAGRPKLLLMLIEEFQRFRRLPDNRRELFARAALRMSDEHDPERHEILARSGRAVVSVEHIHPVVVRIAAVMLLCGKSRVLLDSQVTPDDADLSLAELIGGAEPLGAGSFDVDERHVRAALDTAHFVACGPARIGFDHQSMAEFMAAEYLRRCTAPQLRSLLTQRVDGASFLLPQFREISAWLASHHREFRADVLAREPRLLIEADAVELDEPARREAVEALLSQMDREEAFDVDESESFLRSLRPAPLARQLRPWIVDATRNVVVHCTAIRLAGIARCRALRDDLWKLLAEPQQSSIRPAIIDALQRIGTPADRLNFLRALRGEFGPDPQDELKGAALRFLVPRHLPVRAVLEHLTPRADDFFGSYWVALEYDLPKAIRPADVLPILDRTARLGKNGGFIGTTLPIANAALKIALTHFGNRRLRSASVRLLALLAIVLLRSRLSRDPKLRAVVRTKWIPAVLHGLYNGEPELDAATKFVCALDRRACLAWCVKELNYEQQKDSEFSSLRRFKHCWDTGFTNVVTRFALACGRSPRALLSAFTLLRDVAPNDARELWRKLNRHAIQRTFGKCERMIAFIGLFGVPVDGWDASLTRLQRRSRATRIRFFIEHARLLNYHFRRWSSALGDRRLADLYLLLVDLFPTKTLGDYTRGGSMSPRDYIGDMQRACIGSLVQCGNASACASLRRICKSVPHDDRIWARWKLREAIDQRLRTEWTRDQPAPAALLRMTRAASAVRVRDDGELQAAVLASLARLQAAMHAGQFPKIPNFWREPGATPHLEREIARRIAEWFNADLRGDAGLVVDREPQVGWKGNLDIKIEVPPNPATQRPRLTVVIEVKRCLHDKVRTACATQLAEGYLRRKKLTHGIYLVAWFDVPASKVCWLSAEEAQDEVASWASSAAISPLSLRGFVLDCRWLGLEAPSDIQTTPRVGSELTGALAKTKRAR